MPAVGLKTFYRRLEQMREQSRIDNIARGLWAYDQELETGQDIDTHEWPLEQYAAYLLRRGTEDLEDVPRDLKSWIQRIQLIWDKWNDMEGDNPPLARCTAGPRRDFDINIDGMAHYGLLPDMLQDIRNAGLKVEDFEPLFRGVEDYVRMWEKCGRHAQSKKTQS